MKLKVFHNNYPLSSEHPYEDHYSNITGLSTSVLQKLGNEVKNISENVRY